MAELIDLVRVVVDHPGVAQIALDRPRRDRVVGAVDPVVDPVQQELEADDLGRGDGVALLAALAIRRTQVRQRLLGERRAGQREQRAGESRNREDRLHSQRGL